MRQNWTWYRGLESKSLAWRLEPVLNRAGNYEWSNDPEHASCHRQQFPSSSVSHVQRRDFPCVLHNYLWGKCGAYGHASLLLFLFSSLLQVDSCPLSFSWREDEWIEERAWGESRISRKQSLSYRLFFAGGFAKSFKTVSTSKNLYAKNRWKRWFCFISEDVCIEDEINKWWMVLNFLSRKFIKKGQVISFSKARDKMMRVRLYKLFAILNRVIIKRKLYLDIVREFNLKFHCSIYSSSL